MWCVVDKEAGGDEVNVLAEGEGSVFMQKVKTCIVAQGLCVVIGTLQTSRGKGTGQIFAGQTAKFCTNLRCMK